MAERSPAEGGALSAEQLLTGIGKLIYTLNESVLGIGGRLERLETSMRSVLEERLDGIASLVERTNAGLAELAAKQGPAPEPAVVPDPTPAIEAVVSSVDCLRESVSAAPATLSSIEASLAEIRDRLAPREDALAPLVKAVSDATGEIPAMLVTLSGRMDELVGGIDSVRSTVEGLGAGIAAVVTESGSGIRPVLEGVRERLASLDGIMISLYEAVKGLSGPSSGSADLEALKPGLERMAATLSESAGLLGSTLTGALERSDASRSVLLEERLAPVVERLSTLQEGVESLRESLRESLTGTIAGLREETAGTVRSLSEAVEKGIADQAEQIGRMTGLLETHAAEVGGARAGELNRRAIASFNEGDLDTARKLLSEALGIRPESPELHANLAHVEAAAGDLGKAEAGFRKALEIDPALEPAVSGLGALMVFDGRPEDGIRFLSGFIAGGGEQSPGVMLALARAYASSGRHRDAVELLERALQAAPGHPGIETELAQYREDATAE